MPDEPAAPRPAAPRAQDAAGRTQGAGPGAPTDEGPGPAPTSARWRVDSRLTGMKIAGTVIFAVAAVVLRGDPLGLALSVVAALVLLAYSARDLVAPVRLAADADGVTVVAGFARRERLRWEQIEGVRVDRRRRLGTVSELLEIDTGEGLHLFSAYDLGAPPPEAEATLRAIHATVRS
jgi:Bacterial PH domain